MKYILTLNNINDADLHKVGYKALDYAKVFQSKYKTPLSFVVPNVFFDEFLTQTRVGHDINHILARTKKDDIISLNKSYEKIKEVFRNAKMPEELEEQLQEAYETLSVSSNTGAAQALLSDSQPKVNLISSPDYITDYESTKGLLLNLQGFDFFIVGIKSCWLSLFHPQEVMHRYKKDIKDFNTSIIVQKVNKSSVSAESYSKGPLGDYEIVVKAYFGLIDLTKKTSKDIFSVSKEYLTIESSKKSRQEYEIVPSKEVNTIIKRPLGNKGTLQKIPDKIIIEIARLTKRMKPLIKADFKAHFGVTNDEPFFILINRFNEELEEIQEKNSEITEQIKTPEESTASGILGATTAAAAAGGIIETAPETDTPIDTNEYVRQNEELEVESQEPVESLYNDDSADSQDNDEQFNVEENVTEDTNEYSVDNSPEESYEEPIQTQDEETSTQTQNYEEDTPESQENIETMGDEPISDEIQPVIEKETDDSENSSQNNESPEESSLEVSEDESTEYTDDDVGENTTEDEKEDEFDDETIVEDDDSDDEDEFNEDIDDKEDESTEIVNDEFILPQSLPKKEEDNY